MEMLESEESKGKSQSIRQDEISGKQHLFHSLPKELHSWHNTQYVLEKKLDIDQSSIPESLLNGYMWKIFSDASSFGSITSVWIIVCILYLKMNPTLFGFFIALFLYVPWLLYLMFHFVFYAKIRAQVVGPVTKKCNKFTAQSFNTTFAAITISVMIAFLFTFSFLEEIAVLFNALIAKMPDAKGYSGELKSYTISAYNFLVDLLSAPNTIPGMIFGNIYISTFIFYGLTAAGIFFFEKSYYDERKKEVEAEKILEELSKGYPLDAAMKTMNTWRKDNGV